MQSVKGTQDLLVKLLKELGLNRVEPTNHDFLGSGFNDLIDSINQVVSGPGRLRDQLVDAE